MPCFIRHMSMAPVSYIAIHSYHSNTQKEAEKKNPTRIVMIYFPFNLYFPCFSLGAYSIPLWSNASAPWSVLTTWVHDGDRVLDLAFHLSELLGMGRTLGNPTVGRPKRQPPLFFDPGQEIQKGAPFRTTSWFLVWETWETEFPTVFGNNKAISEYQQVKDRDSCLQLQTESF